MWGSLFLLFLVAAITPAFVWFATDEKPYDWDATQKILHFVARWIAVTLILVVSFLLFHGPSNSTSCDMTYDANGNETCE